MTSDGGQTVAWIRRDVHQSAVTSHLLTTLQHIAIAFIVNPLECRGYYSATSNKVGNTGR